MTQSTPSRPPLLLLFRLWIFGYAPPPLKSVPDDQLPNELAWMVANNAIGTLLLAPLVIGLLPVFVPFLFGGQEPYWQAISQSPVLRKCLTDDLPWFSTTGAVIYMLFSLNAIDERARARKALRAAGVPIIPRGCGRSTSPNTTRK